MYTKSSNIFKGMGSKASKMMKWSKHKGGMQFRGKMMRKNVVPYPPPPSPPDEPTSDEPTPITVPVPTSTPSVSPSSPPSPTPSVPPSETPPDSIQNVDGFDCVEDGGIGFVLNRSPPDHAFPQIIPIDPTDPDSRCFLRMTQDVAEGVATSAFVPFTFSDVGDLPPGQQPGDFRMSIGYRVFGSDAGSADGMVFVMHQDPRGANALGNDGGELGVYGSDNGIRNALVIEWDTFPNEEYLDNGENNIHIVTSDADGVLTELDETQDIPIRTDDSGAVEGRMWVDYCNGELQISINNQGDVRSPAPQATSTDFDLTSFFSQGNSVFVGYTASIAGEADNQDIMNWEFQQGCN